MSIKKSFSIAPQLFTLDVEKLHVIEIIEVHLPLLIEISDRK